jgi:hypothetical protein
VVHGTKLWLVYTAAEYRALLGGLAAAGLPGEAGQGCVAARGALDRRLVRAEHPSGP